MSSSDWVSTSMPYVAPADGASSDAWAAEAATKGRRGSQRIVHAGEVAAPAEVADLLGVSAGASVVVRRRVMYLDDWPDELTDTYYPVEIARDTGLASTAKIPGGAVRLLTRLGHTGVRVREDVQARMPDEEERETLRIGPDEPVLRLTRLTLDHSDRPIQADMMTMPAARRRLRYEIRIG
ncbi:transcriptional regulator [Streptomyces griseoflavus]|uniref:GntR family transcriptional regulator n=1 Tax=Streptomyces rimosus TaxID=1927 RepID=UPI0004C5C322|nr:UTRA domain-containing protein [Streptomyces rimosus]KOG65680.1 transcriptional regulator [Streptomyces griseoflavus]